MSKCGALVAICKWTVVRDSVISEGGDKIDIYNITKSPAFTYFDDV